MKLRFSASALFAAIVLFGNAAQADVLLPLDPHHTSATFTVAHLTISRVSGQIPLIDAHVKVRPDGIPTTADATLDITKIETQDAHRDDDLRSDKWFDAAKYPTLVFHSTQVQPGQHGHFTMIGMMTLHGVTKPITLDGTYNGHAVDPMGVTHYGYSMTGTIDRNTWGIGHAPSAIVGDDISLSIQAEALTK